MLWHCLHPDEPCFTFPTCLSSCDCHISWRWLFRTFYALCWHLLTGKMLSGGLFMILSSLHCPTAGLSWLLDLTSASAGHHWHCIYYPLTPPPRLSLPVLALPPQSSTQAPIWIQNSGFRFLGFNLHNHNVLFQCHLNPSHVWLSRLNLLPPLYLWGSSTHG